MSYPVMSVEIRFEHDVVLVRQRARALAARLGFDTNDQTRISTSASELARNAFQYAGGGHAEFFVDGAAPPQIFGVRIRDRGPGIADLEKVLSGRFRSPNGMGIGLTGTRRLMDVFKVSSVPGGGTEVVAGKTIPAHADVITREIVDRIVAELALGHPQNPIEELQRQNQELLRALAELRQRQEELENLNRELEDTNRGIVALYAELDEKASHLDRANELKARFLSNMSHEFRTPLNSIVSLTRLLHERADGSLTEEQERQVLYIRKAAEDLTLLVNDLLDLAKIEAGKVEVRPAEFRIDTLFSTLRGMLKPLLVNPAVTLAFDDPAGFEVMDSDEGKVAQILRNLLSNAIKFTERGEIRVAARLLPGEDRVRFTVADTGIGIPPEHHARIFEEYAQVDGPLQRKTRGTGLGLPLSRRLAELLGGTLTLERSDAGGSVFEVDLPRVWNAARLGAPAAPAPSGTPDPLRHPVLVLEDDEATLALYIKFLEPSGYQVLPARTVAEARRALRETRPVAVVLDLLIAGESGWEFISEIAGDPRTMGIPVLIATVLEDRARGFALGATDFATKPVERKWLLSRLSKVVQGKTGAKALLIDDEEMSRYILKGALASTKFSILEASGGEEGLRIARAEAPDVIFLDLCMPGMDGFETLVRLREDPLTAAVPVIVVSSKSLSAEERGRLARSAASIIPKSVTSREEMLTRVRECLASGGPVVHEAQGNSSAE